jgi:serine/threonine protein kinase
LLRRFVSLSLFVGHASDFKSPNILISRDWTAKISDFGGSRYQTHTSFMTVTHVGTTRWMAPELHQRQPYTQKMDIYSFGIVLWELVSGDIPFSEVRWDTEIAEKVVRGERPPIPPECSDRLRDLIEYCWAAEPDVRPSFVEIQAQLIQIAEDLNVIWEDL